MTYTLENLLETEKSALLAHLETARRLRDRSPCPEKWTARIQEKAAKLAEILQQLGEPIPTDIAEAALSAASCSA